MYFRKTISFITIALVLAGCSEYWDKHYLVQTETVNQNVWDAIQNDKDLSMYVDYIKEMGYDSLFKGNDSYTLFAPVNSALTQSGVVTHSMIEYSVITHFVQLVNIKGKQKVQTLSEKFGLFERAGNEVTFDGVLVDFESPLYLNGKYFKLGTVITPKPSLYEFIAQDNPILKEYIDSKDSIILDKEKSRPKGFDEFGNTIYDTVSIVINNFEQKWFPVSEEFRNITGTIVFPKWEKYSSALDQMALNLGGQFKSYADIPKEWQNEILIPHLLTHGVFLNSLEVVEFLPKHAKDTVKLQNMLGDSVIINYLPANRTLCSNGYFYDYSEYTIPDSLYSGKSRIEGESLVRQIGINKFAWRDSVKVKSTQSFEPVRELIANASNDSILKLNFPKGYNGVFTLDFNTMNLFPRKYLMVFRTHMDIGGKYNIYINNQLVKTFEYYDYVRYRGVITGVTGIRYVPEGRFNRFDCLVTLSTYGKAKVKIEYTGPNNVPGNGLVLDYIDFIPNK